MAYNYPPAGAPAGLGAWTDDGVVPIGATTTAPTKGVTAVDKTRFRRISGGMDAQWLYRQTASTGAATGLGAYLITVPNGRSVDTALIRASTNIAVPPASIDANCVGTGFFYHSGDATYRLCQLYVYDATRLKVVLVKLNTGAAVYWSDSDSALSSAPTIIFSANIAGLPIVGW